MNEPLVIARAFHLASTLLLAGLGDNRGILERYGTIAAFGQTNPFATVSSRSALAAPPRPSGGQDDPGVALAAGMPGVALAAGMAAALLGEAMLGVSLLVGEALLVSHVIEA